MAVLDEMMQPGKLDEADVDDWGLVCAVDESGRRWFMWQIPAHVTKDTFIACQDALREVIEQYLAPAGA